MKNLSVKISIDFINQPKTNKTKQNKSRFETPNLHENLFKVMNKNNKIKAPL